MRLATTFAKNRIEVSSPNGWLSEDELRRAVPAAFAAAPHSSRSDRYAYIPTAEIIRGYEREGFRPTFATQARPRDADRFETTKHMLRFRRQADIGRSEASEIVVINSHGGESAVQIFGGVFRFICCNGMVCGDTFEEVRVRHSPSLVNEVIEGAYRVVDGFERVRGTVDTMKAIGLSRPEQLALAHSAAVLRFDLQDGEQAPVTAESIIRPRRSGDEGNDLWTCFNRTQEAVIRGGLHGATVNADGRRRRVTTRAVAGIDQNITLNRALWALAERMAELKGA